MTRVAARDGSTGWRIRASALNAFARRGYSAAGIREIAQGAGISSSVLYHYFPTKQHLLADLTVLDFKALWCCARKLIPDRAVPESRLAALVQTHLLFQYLNGQGTVVLDREMRLLDQEGWQQAVVWADAYEAMWKSAVNDGVREGVFLVSDPHLGRLAVLEMCDGFNHWFVPGRGLSASDVTDAFINIALAALRTSRAGDEITLERLSIRSSLSALTTLDQMMDHMDELTGPLTSPPDVTAWAELAADATS